ncbi:synaptoporin [Trichuris trichiura]|uniref:Synaptoporin n=1 Tax=Trichuris trichiura TaxID=36087 RepID=A0A077Z6L6_TRITR|nr:synaptoporin [Trichuris trichiura]
MSVMVAHLVLNLTEVTTLDGRIHSSKLQKERRAYCMAAAFVFPSSLTNVFIPANFCDPSSPKKYIFGEGAVSQSQFFVCTGILSFLYILAILCVYLFQMEKYETDNRWPAMDFLITAILALFWFISSCAWAAGVSSLKSITEPVNVGARVIENSAVCSSKDHACKFEHDYNFASLNVSLIAGFACFFLFASNLWFIWKETEWFKSRHPPASTTAPSSGPPQSASYSGPR